MSDYRSPKWLRLKGRKEIAHVFDAGRRKSDGVMMLYAVENGRDFARFCVAVGHKHGGAVQRNRIKRLCREAIRLTRADLPTGFDFCLLPRAGADLTLAKLQQSLRELAKRVG